MKRVFAVVAAVLFSAPLLPAPAVALTGGERSGVPSMGDLSAPLADTAAPGATQDVPPVALEGPAQVFVEARSPFFVPELARELRELGNVHIIDQFTEVTAGVAALMPGELLPDVKSLRSAVNVVAVPVEESQRIDLDAMDVSEDQTPSDFTELKKRTFADAPYASENSTNPVGALETRSTAETLAARYGPDLIDQTSGVLDGKFTTPVHGGNGARIYMPMWGVFGKTNVFPDPIAGGTLSTGSRLTVSPGTRTSSDARSDHDCLKLGLEYASAAAGWEWGVARKANITVVGIPCRTDTWLEYIAALEWIAKDIQDNPGSTKPVVSLLSPVWQNSINGMDKAWPSQYEDVKAQTTAALHKLNDLGAVIVTETRDCGFPANLPFTLAVAGVTSDGKALFSPGGCVDVWSPSQTLVASRLPGSAVGTAQVKNTQYASATAAGVVALLRTDAPHLTPAQVIDWLKVHGSSVVTLPSGSSDTTRRLIHYLPENLPSPRGTLLSRTADSVTIQIANYWEVENSIYGESRYKFTAGQRQVSYQEIADGIFTVTGIPASAATVTVTRYSPGALQAAARFNIKAYTPTPNTLTVSPPLPMGDGFDIYLDGVTAGDRFTFSNPTGEALDGEYVTVTPSPVTDSRTRVSIRGLPENTSTSLTMYRHFPGTAQTQQYILAGSTLNGFRNNESGRVIAAGGLTQTPVTPETKLFVHIRADENTIGSTELQAAIEGLGGQVYNLYTTLLLGVDAEVPYYSVNAVMDIPGITYMEQWNPFVEPARPLQQPDRLGNPWAHRDTATSVLDPAPWWLDRLDQPELPLDGQFRYPSSAGAGATIYVDEPWAYNASKSDSNRLYGDRLRTIGELCPSDSDPSTHTHLVAALAGGKGIGIATKAQIVPVSANTCINGKPGHGKLHSLEMIAQDIQRRGTQDGPSIVNLSWGPYFEWAKEGWFTKSGPFVSDILSGNYNTAVPHVAALARTYGAMIVKAAGNDGSNEAACVDPVNGTIPGVIVVGGTAENDSLMWNGNYGDCVDIYGPAVNIEVPGISPPTSGTSYATPLVSGWLAVLATEYPSASFTDLKNTIIGDASRTITTYPIIPTGTNWPLLQAKIAAAPPATLTVGAATQKVTDGNSLPVFTYEMQLDMAASAFPWSPTGTPAVTPWVGWRFEGDSQFNPVPTQPINFSKDGFTATWPIDVMSSKTPTVEVHISIPGRETTTVKVTLSKHLATCPNNGDRDCGDLRRVLNSRGEFVAAPEPPAVTDLSVKGQSVTFTVPGDTSVVRVAGRGQPTQEGTRVTVNTDNSRTNTVLVVSRVTDGVPAATSVTIPAAGSPLTVNTITLAATDSSASYPVTYDSDSARWELPGGAFAVTGFTGMTAARISASPNGESTVVTGVGVETRDTSTVTISRVSESGLTPFTVLTVPSETKQPPRLHVRKPVLVGGVWVLRASFPYGYGLEDGQWSIQGRSGFTFTGIRTDPRSSTGGMVAEFTMSGSSRGASDLVRVTSTSDAWGAVSDYRILKPTTRMP